MSSKLTHANIRDLAESLFEAQTKATAVPKLTNKYPDLSIDEAYQIQLALKDLYLEAGHRIVGYKAGLTSKAKMLQMGVDAPSMGFITERMNAPEGTVIDTRTLVHPRVECEVAFVLNKDLPSTNCRVDDVLASTAYVVGAIEIIDSRYENFKFDLESVIADNSSSARYVLSGNGYRLDDLNRKTLGVALLKNGELLSTGASAAVLGDPAAGVAMTANLVGKYGGTIKAGMVVLSGGITAAEAVSPGDHISARFQSLGVVDIRFA